MKITKFLAIALMAMTLTGCLDHDDDANEVTRTFTYDQCFAVVQDVITGEKTIVEKPKVTVLMVSSNSKFTGQITLTNFQLPNLPNYTYELPATAVSEQTADNIMRIESAQMIPTNLSGASVLFSNVKMGILQLGYLINGQVMLRPSFSLHFEYNGKYRVDVYPLEQTMYAVTTTNPESDPSDVFTTQETTYTYQFDPATQKCSIEIKGAKFVAEMPAMDMKFPGIPFISDNGTLKLSIPELTPTIREVEYPQFPITDLAASFTPLQNSTLTFSCNPGGRGLYGVTAALQYTSVQ